MKKISFKFLTKKYGPLPGWAWATISAALIYLLYRHFQNSGGSSGATSSPMTMGDATTTAPGDMTGSTPGNAGDLGATTGGTFDSGGLGGDFSGGGGDVGGALDSGQGDTTGDTSSSTDSSSATLGLTHISGDYWWDPDQHKLIKIPGSGGQKKGSGKKKAPKAKGKKAGKKQPIKKKPNKHMTARIRSRAHKAPAVHRNISSPGHPQKHRILPKPQPHTIALKPTQRAAIDRAHHPEARRATPINKPAARKAVRKLPSRPAPRKRK